VNPRPSSTPYDIFSLGSYSADKRFVLNALEEFSSPGGHLTPEALDLASKLAFRLLALGEWDRA
jgi:hypothetical protein